MSPVVIVAAGMDAALVASSAAWLRGSDRFADSIGDGVADGGGTAMHAALASCAPGSRSSISTMATARLA